MTIKYDIDIPLNARLDITINCQPSNRFSMIAVPLN